MTAKNPINEQLTSLSYGERRCLSLVQENMTSKEIALHLDLSPHTVDGYIKSAMAKLRAPNRREAARLASLDSVPQRLVDQRSSIVESEPDGETSIPTGVNDAHHERFWIPPFGGPKNQMSTADKVFAILRISVTAIAVVTVLTLVIAALLWIIGKPSP